MFKSRKAWNLFRVSEMQIGKGQHLDLKGWKNLMVNGKAKIKAPLPIKQKYTTDCYNIDSPNLSYFCWSYIYLKL